MQSLCKSYGVYNLYHFTCAYNLNNIFSYGLLPRNMLDSQHIGYYHNDNFRYDQCLNAVCLSIEHPNYKMFYKLRMANQDVPWAVIELDAAILNDFDCAYCWTNAGDAMMYNTSLAEKMTKDAFINLFSNYDGYPDRNSLNIPSCYPTNPQAEVLVFDKIPTEYIHRVYFDDRVTLNCFAKYIPDKYAIGVNSVVFAPRCDYRHWQRG